MSRFRRISQALRGLVVLGAAVALALALSSGPVAARSGGPQVAPAKGAGDLRRVVFSSRNLAGGLGNSFHLFSINEDGTNLTNLTSGNGFISDLDPAWSPDGTTVAFASACPAAVRCLYTIKNDGTLLRRLTSRPNRTDQHPAWSPDGTHLVFVSDRSGSRQLWTVSALDGTVQQLTTEEGLFDPQNPNWSPDGLSIVFSDRGNLYLIGNTGSKLRPFVLSGKAATPDWSPDGSAIVYMDGNTIWVRSTDGLTSTLVGTYQGARTPRWSPDGTRIMFSARDANEYQHLYMVDSLGIGLKQVTIGISDDITPDW